MCRQDVAKIEKREDNECPIPRGVQDSNNKLMSPGGINVPPTYAVKPHTRTVEHEHPPKSSVSSQGLRTSPLFDYVPIPMSSAGLA